MTWEEKQSLSTLLKKLSACWQLSIRTESCPPVENQ